MYFWMNQDFLLQFYSYLGALCFLVNKIYLSQAERARDEETELTNRALAWKSYLRGLPFIVVLFYETRGWLAASVEAAGAPAVYLGLVRAKRGKKSKLPVSLFVFALAASVLGLCGSLYLYRGLTEWSQVCELGLSVGYFVGTFLLAYRDDKNGYLWYVLMHVAGAAYFYIIPTTNWVMVIFQVVSIGFVVDAYCVRRKR